MADDDDGEPIEGLSFWEPLGYKKTTKRITDGNRLCDEIVEMVQERCEIEKDYAKSLKNWAKKWGAQIEKGPEYGSMESAWKAVLNAADRDADVHLRVRDNLGATVVNEIRRWQKENFHKGLMSLHLKEKKEMDEEFKKAQKPWAKKLKLVEKYKTEYHSLCQKEQSAMQRSKNQQSDPAVSEDQKAKTLDEVNKLGSQRLSARGSYEDALKDLNSYNARYMEDMKEVYQRCQEMENKRLEFFKDRLLAMHQGLDLSNDVVMKQIFADYLHTLEAANSRSDLKWWDMQRGVDMPMNWPQFEEWKERMAPIVNGGLGSTLFTKQQDGSTIRGGTFRKKTEETTAVSPSLTTRSIVTTTTTTNLPPNRQISGLSSDSSVQQQRPIAASRESLNRHSSSRESLHSAGKSPFDSDDDGGVVVKKTVEERLTVVTTPVPAVRASVTGATAESARKSFDNPFNEPDWSESGQSGKSGVRVKALYAYGGEEADELSFKEGDVFEKIEERDEQGWCKGRKDGKVGLFPADYVEPV